MSISATSAFTQRLFFCNEYQTARLKKQTVSEFDKKVITFYFNLNVDCTDADQLFSSDNNFIQFARSSNKYVFKYNSKGE